MSRSDVRELGVRSKALAQLRRADSKNKKESGMRGLVTDQASEHFIYSLHLNVDFFAKRCVEVTKPFCNLHLCVQFA